MSRCLLTSDTGEAFLRVVFHADEDFLGVSFRALYNLTEIPGLFIDPNVNMPLTMPPRQFGKGCQKKKKKKDWIQTSGEIWSCIM